MFRLQPQQSICNRNKGSDIGSLISGSVELVRFYHPRLDRWHEHFQLDRGDGITIIPASAIGEATARIFGFNTEERLLERQALQVAGRYPMPAARRLMSGATEQCAEPDATVRLPQRYRSALQAVPQVSLAARPRVQWRS